MKQMLLTILLCCICFISFSQQKKHDFTVKIENSDSKKPGKDSSFTLTKDQLKKMLSMDSLYSSKKGIRAYVSNKNCSNMPVEMINGNISNMAVAHPGKMDEFTMPVIVTDSVNMKKTK